MKRLSALLVALVMIFAMTATYASATSITFAGDADRTYDGYQLLGLTTSLKTDAHPEACDGTDHVDGCYNYAYTVNEKYLDILKAETYENYTWTADVPQPATAAEVTVDQILDHLAVLTSDVDGVSGTLRPVADRIFRAIVDAGIGADALGISGTTEIAKGYWMFADVTDLDDTNRANSLIMVDTKGENDITVTPKVSIPTIEKKVFDVNDTTGDSAWLDAADHDIKDDVSFKLTATLPSNLSSYESYTIAFHDTMSAGLTFKADTVKVYMYASADDAAAGVDATDVTDSFDTATTDIGNETFVVSCDDILAIDGVDSETVFVVCYDATLNEGAVIGAEGNPNEVYLEFSNNPYTDGTGKTENDKVIVFTYKVVINKVDADGNALKGAGFKLYKQNADGDFELIGDELIGDEMTTFTWNGIDDGVYKLEESTVPSGYNKMDDIVFTVTATHSETADAPELITLTGDIGTGDVVTGAITESVVNNTGTVLPETGAKGTFLLISGGALLVVLAAVFMITRKKMSVYEA